MRDNKKDFSITLSYVSPGKFDARDGIYFYDLHAKKEYDISEK